MNTTRKALIQVNDLKVHYPVKVKRKGPVSETRYVKAVDGVSFSVFEGETFGIVGESGCGKSTTGKVLVKLLAPTEGTILFEGRDIVKQTKEEELAFKKRMQIIFQDPHSSLDPRFTVERILYEPLKVHKMGTFAQRRKRVAELMREVGLREEYRDRYPHEFSGGQRQRIGVARALALRPSMIVCDEPVSALDVSIQAQILNLMQELQQKHELTYLFISHNVSVVKHICDRIAVMYLGNIVEIAGKKSLFECPAHPYTRALLDAVPIPDPAVPSMTGMLEGDVPNPMSPPVGCCFHTRCPMTADICRREKPVLREVGDGHQAACHFCDSAGGTGR